MVLLDVLRGFALGGVFVSNAYMHLSGRGLLPRASARALESTRVDAVAAFLFEELVAGKAMFLFSLLFGLGFSIQLIRAEERGRSIVPVYVRRLGVLLLIGLIHRFALWYGDILTTYAVMGFVLLVMRKLPDRRLLVWSLLLMFLAPVAVAAVVKLTPLLASSREIVAAANQEDMARVAAIRRQTLEAFSSGSYLTTARANIEFLLRVFTRTTTVSWMLVVLGRFLLGLLAGRRRLFHDVERHQPFFRKLLVWGLGTSVVGNGAKLLFGNLARSAPAGSSWRQVWELLQPAVSEVGIIGTAACYAAGFALLFQRPRWQRILGVLAPAGQMALTNYLCQTLISQFIYYGYGFNLIGKQGPAECLLLMSSLFCVQVWLSHLWLARFRFGPAEWVWRCLTYGQRQPLLREGHDSSRLHTSSNSSLEISEGSNSESAAISSSGGTGASPKRVEPVDT
ncbi:DUF418 domain-containing protein [Archangium lansingense]|uniref:DUF418 domain-containing protein n=1 Tax=Archangium lansingense TaxID=2995310 RepID=UPI003B78F10C